MSELVPSQLTQYTLELAEVELRVQQTDHDLVLLQHELNRSGQQYGIQSPVPTILHRFFLGEIDLDTELGKRFAGPPLLSEIKFRPADWQLAQHGTATMTSQDGSAALTVDGNRETGIVELSFTLGAMLSLRFTLMDLPEADRRRWLDLMRREQGVAFLWGATRWERDYMIFVVRQYTSRAYSFSPNRFESAICLTSDVLTQFLDWLENFWS